MNGKETVSKELNDRHAKILQCLLKYPENRECADCQSKAPRWASINLGIFICMQCSGIHRSLGVHISKVRSITLDTWLPDQVAFMQKVGNKKSNEYWEAELPPQFNKKPIEKFIRSKYVEKKWASRTSMQPTGLISENKSGGTSASGIPRKARKYSLDEGFFAKNISLITPTARNRGGSMETMSSIVSAPPGNITAENSTSSTNAAAAKDLFSLLYVPEGKPDRTVVPPSRWATFDCNKISEYFAQTKPAYF